MLYRFIADEEGAETLEYVALIAAAIVLVGVVRTLTTKNKNAVKTADLTPTWPSAAQAH